MNTKTKKKKLMYANTTVVHVFTNYFASLAIFLAQPKQFCSFSATSQEAMKNLAALWNVPRAEVKAEYPEVTALSFLG